MEIWKDVKGYEGYYQVSNLGRVKSLMFKGIKLRDKILKNGGGNKQYSYVIFCVDKKIKTYRVHRLVAEYFVCNPYNKPHVNHKDGNKFNNRFDNLEWCTHKENMRHAFKNGLNKGPVGEKQHNSKLNESIIREIRTNKDSLSQSKLGKLYKVDQSAISLILNNKNWKHVQ